MKAGGYLLRATAIATVLYSALAAAEELPASIQFSGFADFSLVYTNDADSWLNRGTGKGRFGNDANGNDFEAVVPEAVLISELMFGAAATVHLQLKYDDEQRHAVDIGEAYVLYRSPPRPKMRWRLKVGTFLPPMSLENRAIGWTSPYTLSSSALNTWLGEEIRINGADLRILFDCRDTEVTLSGAAYIGNDPAGTLMAYRGFAIHDRELALFDDAPLPDFQTAIVNPFGPFRHQSDTFEPLHEIDGRVGFYTGLNVNHEAWGKFSFYLYDNNADPEAFNRTAGQYAWHTRFITAGYRGDIAERLTLIVQALYGDTVMGPRFPPKSRHVTDVEYLTAYGLLSRTHERWRYSGRVEYFENNDTDTMRDNYDNDESGWAATGTLMFKPIEQIKLALELQYINHERPVRRYTGAPVRFDEFSARLNLRWFF